MSSWQSAILEQQRSNEQSWHHRETFASHRAHLTGVAIEPAPQGRICILGAGNCADLELEAVAEVYDEVHLVDIDGASLKRAVSLVPSHLREKLRLHSNVDLSGLGDKLDRWATMQVTPDELLAYPAETAESLRETLGGSFDCVLSSCLLSQLHLLTRRVLTENHPLADAVTFSLNLAHLRTLLELTCKSGQAHLVTDVTSNEIVALAEIDCAKPLKLLSTLLGQHDVFQSVDPRVLAAVSRDDPVLAARARLSEPTSAWLWQNGPQRRFLVYAMTLTPTQRLAG